MYTFRFDLDSYSQHFKTSIVGFLHISLKVIIENSLKPNEPDTNIRPRDCSIQRWKSKLNSYERSRVIWKNGGRYLTKSADRCLELLTMTVKIKSKYAHCKSFLFPSFEKNISMEMSFVFPSAGDVIIKFIGHAGNRREQIVSIARIIFAVTLGKDLRKASRKMLSSVFEFFEHSLYCETFRVNTLRLPSIVKYYTRRNYSDYT